MRILWLRPSTGDYISVRRERIAEHLREMGFEVVIKDASGRDLPGAIWTALTGDFAVIVGNVRIGLYIGYPLARLRRVPFVGDVSDPLSDIANLPAPLFRLFAWYEWQVLKRADATVFVYESSLLAAKNRGITATRKLPNAVNYDQFADPNEAIIEEARDVLIASGVDLDRPIAIYLGIFSPHYCIDEMLEAASLTPGWEFVFLGEGPLRSAVASSAAKQSNVHYPGAYPYELMPGFLSHAAVGFCFKDAEQPLKLKEYGAAGIPAIVRPGELTAWYGADEVLITDPTPEAISETLTRLAEDDDRRIQYGQALQAIANQYSWKAIATEYAELFTQLGENSP